MKVIGAYAVATALTPQQILASGLIINSTGKDVLRFTPPLTVSAEEVDDALVILREVLAGS